MDIRNIPNLNRVINILAKSEAFKKLDKDDQNYVFKRFQHYTDNFSEKNNKIICLHCVFRPLKDQSLSGQIKHYLAHILDNIRKMNTSTRLTVT